LLLLLAKFDKPGVLRHGRFYILFAQLFVSYTEDYCRWN
jgi:hypothetical protein